MGVIFHVINYNLILYIGLVFYVLIIVLFIANEMDKRKKDREQWLSNQLSTSFEKGKNYERKTNT
jgi:hypothetical protein